MYMWSILRFCCYCCVVVTSNHHGIMMMVVIFPTVVHCTMDQNMEKSTSNGLEYRKMNQFTEALAGQNFKVVI